VLGIGDRFVLSLCVVFGFLVYNFVILKE